MICFKSQCSQGKNHRPRYPASVRGGCFCCCRSANSGSALATCSAQDRCSTAQPAPAHGGDGTRDKTPAHGPHDCRMYRCPGPGQEVHPPPRFSPRLKLVLCPCAVHAAAAKQAQAA